MFPMLFEKMKDLVPEVYFGGAEVPAYLHADGSPTLRWRLSSLPSVRFGVGTNSSGYIDDEGIHFHIPDDELIHVDLSKRFVFVSQPEVRGGENPSSWQVFRFLQEPVSAALFITLGRATFIHKTEETLLICKILDKLWAEQRFLDTIREMVESEESREMGLVQLMKIYEEKTLGSSSEMWEFWQTFGGLLMEQRLGLSVRTIL